MHTHADKWLPITEYAMRTGTSISTLRRKIKSDSIAYKMEDGRYLLKLDDVVTTDDSVQSAFKSTDRVAGGAALTRAEVEEMIRKAGEENALRWRALEARVNGLARKLDLAAEQIMELKMLVKLFEEKLDANG